MWSGIWLAILLATVKGTSILEAINDLLIESDQELISRMDSGILEKDYDWIIVGAGTAGCVLASRLSEIKEWEVLLVEAGGEEEFFMDIPILVGNLQRGSLDWQYFSEPSADNCHGYDKGQCYIPRGKVFGGSSVLNYMLATRGNRKDYDLWESLGNPGWSFKDVLPYFIKAENMTIAEYRKDKYHGTTGPLAISQSRYRTKLGEAFIQAGRELGHRSGDYNSQSQTVFSYFQFTKKNARRMSNPRAYIYPVIKTRKNLHIAVRTFVTKLIISDTGDVQGVHVEQNGQHYQVNARKEVILSAGAINSPQILMLSGIGPRTHLDQMKIPVIQNLPVGQNFQDHVSFAGLIFTTNITDNELNATCIANNPQYFVDFVRKGYGPYEIPGGNEGVFFYDTSSPNNPDGLPDLEIHFSSVSPIPEQTVRGFSRQTYQEIFQPFEHSITWAIQPILMHPKSRGSVELSSNNPHEKPKIKPNYFQHPDDVLTVIKGIRKALEISETKAFQVFGSKLSSKQLSRCKNEPFKSDAYWSCMMKTTTITNYHQCCTCSMGPDGVVDERLRVRGLKRLRVIDASIMPTVPTAHTNVPTNMVAERGADIIKEDYSLKT